MKLALAFVLYFSTTLNCTFVESNSCMDQSYEIGVPAKVKNKFKNEFSKLEFVKRKFECIFGPAEKPYSIKDEMSKQLCACAFYKMNEKTKIDIVDENENIITTRQSFEEILKQTTSSKNRIIIPIWFTIFPIRPKFPVIICYSGEEMCAITKGLKKKSDERPIYDIYVGNIVNENERFKFQGIISDVDLELPAQPKTEVP